MNEEATGRLKVTECAYYTNKNSCLLNHSADRSSCLYG